MPAPLLQITNLSKAFGAVRALEGVSFDLNRGEVHALVGENGAGKSTLVKIMTGAERPDEGSIKIDGKPQEQLSPGSAHKLGLVCIYQQPALFPELTVAENVALRAQRLSPFSRVYWSQCRVRASQLLNQIGANISSHREVRELSMPEQQLVEIACACGVGARIVLMDEPTASLTQKEQHLLFKVVRQLRQSGVGVVYISHRLDEVFALADRVTVLRDGQSVGTYRSDQLNEKQLIRFMVGREVPWLYPPAGGTRGEVLLSVQNVGCASTGIRNVSMEIRRGEIVGLAGLVGAGRTELAHMLFGITPIDSGEILFAGRNAVIGSPQDAIALGIAYVPEDRRRYGIILEMPVTENVTMAIHPTLFPNSWLRFSRERELACRYIRDLQVKADSPYVPAFSLSGGNQQKVSIARWLATNPQLLILDEPTQGVDVGAKAEIHKIIHQLANRGVAVLLISSDLQEVIGMSDRIGLMRNGTIAGWFPAGSTAQQVMERVFGRSA